MILFDASALIAFFARTDSFHESARELMRRCARQEWGAASITLAQFLVGPARVGGPAQRAARDGLDRLRIAELALPTAAAADLAVLRARTGLKLPDCVVLLTAWHHDAAIATFDRRLPEAARGEGLGVVTE